MSASGGGNLISVQPEELKFTIELDKQSFCDLKVANTTSNHVAFKVKTTSPKKYFVRPNTGVIQPWDACVIRVTLQAQREYPPDLQCKDKFLLQSVVVPPHTDVDELAPDAFNKENSDKSIEELKLRVVYAYPSSPSDNPSQVFDDDPGIQRLREEKDAAFRVTQQLQRELELLRRRRPRSTDSGFSVTSVFVVGILSLLLGFLFKLMFGSSSAQ